MDEGEGELREGVRYDMAEDEGRGDGRGCKSVGIIMFRNGGIKGQRVEAGHGREEDGREDRGVAGNEAE